MLFTHAKGTREVFTELTFSLMLFEAKLTCGLTRLKNIGDRVTFREFVAGRFFAHHSQRFFSFNEVRRQLYDDKPR